MTLSARLSVTFCFSLRLWRSVAMALLPVMLRLMVTEFVADRLRRESERRALELAAIARKAVQDFGCNGANGRQPARHRRRALYIASLVRNDLDVLRADASDSSKRRLYASGLLPSRVEGGVFAPHARKAARGAAHGDDRRLLVIGRCARDLRARPARSRSRRAGSGGGARRPLPHDPAGLSRSWRRALP
jgi:hypothetical protein